MKASAELPTLPATLQPHAAGSERVLLVIIPGTPGAVHADYCLLLARSCSAALKQAGVWRKLRAFLPMLGVGCVLFDVCERGQAIRALQAHMAELDFANRTCIGFFDAAEGYYRPCGAGLTIDLQMVMGDPNLEIAEAELDRASLSAQAFAEWLEETLRKLQSESKEAES